MVRWLVTLNGDDYHLERLAQAPWTGDVTIAKRGRQYILRANQLDALTDQNQVLENAEDLITAINGVASLLSPAHVRIWLGGLTEMNDDGTVRTLTAISNPFDVLPSLEATPASELFKDLPPLFRLATQNEYVLDALRYFTGSWQDLYKSYENICKDVGGGRNTRGEDRIVKRGWAMEKQLDRFRHTANYYGRHGVGRVEPPKRPMSLKEARRLIRDLAYKWVRFKLEQT